MEEIYRGTLADTLEYIAINVDQFCDKGDLVGVKGRLQCLSGNELQVVAEKITFLSSRKE